MVLQLTTSASVPALFPIKLHCSGINSRAILEELHSLTNFRGLQIDSLIFPPESTALKTSSKEEAVLCLRLVSGDDIAGLQNEKSTSDTK